MTDAFDLSVAAARAELDAEIVRSGAAARVREGVLARVVYDPMAGFGWPRLAAAVLVAAVLGGAFDLVLPEAPADPAEFAMVDPLFALDPGEAR